MAATNDKASANAKSGGREVVKGESLLADAWKRLKKNRIAVVSMVFVAFTAVAGYSAPLVATYVTHFSLDEGHSRLAYAPPGTVDISLDHPTYDGDKGAFDAVDLDGDGFIRCKRIPSAQVALSGLFWLQEHAPSLHAEALRKLDRLDEQLPVKGIVRQAVGSLRCPELDELRKLGRHFDFFLDTYDVASGNADPLPGDISPDGYVTWKEFPQSEDHPKFKRKYRNRGLTGREAFALLDADGDQIITEREVTERTRYMRFDAEKLIAQADLDHDLAISRAEFPGAPQLQRFRAGTDSQGRDVFTRMFYGARISITIGLMATFVSLLIGVIYGSVAGYFGGRVDNLMMRFVDVMYGLPYLVIVILLIVIIGRSTLNLFIALGCIGWLGLARVIRGQVISLKTREFIEAARATGVGRMAIIFRHLIPNTIGPVIIYSTLLVPGFILQEAFLSFLGLGVQPPDPSWGNMITEGATKIEHQTWLIYWPGTALALTLFAMNFVGDGIRDALDPQMQKD